MKRAVIIILCLCYIGAGGPGEYHENGTVVSRDQAARLVSLKMPSGRMSTPIPKIFPRSGTVSHHLLVAPAINAWFGQLKNLRGVKTFVIISPNHNRITSHPVSLSCDNWKTAGRVTAINKSMVQSLKESLAVPYDRLAFYNEHGIEALLPFINHYFPSADIVPILIDEKNINAKLNKKLATMVFAIMKGNPEAFLLISVDFSHKNGRKKTDERDINSGKSLSVLSNEVYRPYSDNNAGLGILFEVCAGMRVRNNHLFFHTDAEKFTSLPMGNDITSYFFTFQY